jgi:uncharacterized protein YciI
MVEQPIVARRAVQSGERDALCPAPAFFCILQEKTGVEGLRRWRGSLIAVGRLAMLAAVRGTDCAARDKPPPKGRIPMTQERIRELTKTMLRKKLYVVLSKGGAAPEKIAEHLPRHLEYMIGLEKKGVLFASGPLAEADGKTRGDGLTILRAASAQAAREIAEADPFVVHGLRSFELREWTVMEGSLGIKVHFSDQSLELA